MPIVTGVEATGILIKPLLWAHLLEIRLDFMMCTATYWNGSRIAGTIAMKMHQMKARHGWRLMAAIAAGPWYVMADF